MGQKQLYSHPKLLNHYNISNKIFKNKIKRKRELMGDIQKKFIEFKTHCTGHFLHINTSCALWYLAIMYVLPWYATLYIHRLAVPFGILKEGLPK